MKKVLLIILCVLNMGFITYFSSQSAKTSTKVSNSITAKVVIPIMKSAGIPATKDAVRKYDKYTRNAAHVLMFLSLGALLFGTLKCFNLKYAFFCALAFCFLYAIFDESLQHFLKQGRAFEISDLLKDWSGSFFGTLTVYFFSWFKTRRRCV